MDPASVYCARHGDKMVSLSVHWAVCGGFEVKETRPNLQGTVVGGMNRERAYREHFRGNVISCSTCRLHQTCITRLGERVKWYRLTRIQPTSATFLLPKPKSINFGSDPGSSASIMTFSSLFLKWTTKIKHASGVLYITMDNSPLMTVCYCGQELRHQNGNMVFCHFFRVFCQITALT